MNQTAQSVGWIKHGKPDVIFGDSPLAGLNYVSANTGAMQISTNQNLSDARDKFTFASCFQHMQHEQETFHRIFKLSCRFYPKNRDALPWIRRFRQLWKERRMFGKINERDWDIRDVEYRRIQILISVVYNTRRVWDRSPSYDWSTMKVWLL